MSTYTAVFCDDIRQEGNGKHILIGVYGNDLVPGSLPATFPLSLWLKVDDPPLGLRKFKFTLKSSTGDEAGLEGELQLPEDASQKSVVLAFGGLPVQVRSPGQVTAHLSFDGKPAEKVGTLEVTQPRKG